MSTTLSPNMNLPVPGVGTEAAPDYASDVNNCLNIIDQHTHAPGSGTQITPAGLNINTALAFNSNFATGLAGLTLVAQASLPALNTVYESGVDLYFIDGAGNNVRLTQSGAVAGTPGSISNLVTPATASYVSGSSTFVWQSNASIAANMDFGAAILRNLSPNSTFALTLQPPTLGSNYSITLPVLPSTTSVVTIDNSGNMSTTDVAFLNPSGSITMYGGASAPTGYLICDGSQLSRSAYPALFAAIGTAYGTSGSTDFFIPDLRGLFPRGVNNGSGNDPDASTRVACQTGSNVGDNVGSLQASMFTSHSHTDAGHNHNMNIANSGATSTFGGGFGIAVQATPQFTVAGAANILPTGGNETRPRNLYVNFIIKT